MPAWPSGISDSPPTLVSPAKFLRVHCPIIQIINEDFEQDWIHYWHLEHTSSYWPPARLCATDHHPLAWPVSFQSISLFIQLVYQQLLYEDLMGDCSKLYESLGWQYLLLFLHLGSHVIIVYEVTQAWLPALGIHADCSQTPSCPTCAWKWFPGWVVPLLSQGSRWG